MLHLNLIYLPVAITIARRTILVLDKLVLSIFMLLYIFLTKFGCQPGLGSNLFQMIFICNYITEISECDFSWLDKINIKQYLRKRAINVHNSGDCKISFWNDMFLCQQKRGKKRIMIEYVVLLKFYAYNTL